MLNISPATPEMVPEILELMNLALGPSARVTRDNRYWQWKHQDNPFGPSIVLVAHRDGRLVGMRSFMRWQLEHGATTIPVGKPVDTVTHPDYRRQGIFRELTEAACELAVGEGLQLLFNTPNHNSLPGYLKLGWSVVTRVSPLVRVRRPLACLAALLSRQGSRERLDDNGRLPQPAAGLLDDGEAITELLDRNPLSGPRWHTPRSLEFLRWRYASHPHVPYHAELVRRNGRLAGVLFYRLTGRRGLRELMVDDILLGPGDRSCCRALFAQLARRVPADYLLAAAPRHSRLARTLGRRGFLRSPYGPVALVCRSLAPGGVDPDPGRPSSWSLNFGDLEGL